MSQPRYEDGYRREDPRVICTGWEEIYAAWCDSCGSDAETRWDMRTLRGEYPEAWCRHCERVVHVGRAEAHYIREPSRLAARLHELRAASSHQSGEEKP